MILSAKSALVKALPLLSTKEFPYQKVCIKNRVALLILSYRVHVKQTGSKDHVKTDIFINDGRTHHDFPAERGRGGLYWHRLHSAADNITQNN